MDILGIPSDTWLPIFTLILGAVLKGIFDWLIDRRTAEREKDARNALFRDKLRLQRNEFQRATLLELQEAVSKLARFTGRAYHLGVMAFRKSGSWHKQLLSEDVNEGFRRAQNASNRLRVRVRDEGTRKLAQTFSISCVHVTLAQSEHDAEAMMLQMISVLDELHERIGFVLRQLDDDEDQVVQNS